MNIKKALQNEKVKLTLINAINTLTPVIEIEKDKFKVRLEFRDGSHRFESFTMRGWLSSNSENSVVEQVDQPVPIHFESMKVYYYSSNRHALCDDDYYVVIEFTDSLLAPFIYLFEDRLVFSEDLANKIIRKKTNILSSITTVETL